MKEVAKKIFALIGIGAVIAVAVYLIDARFARLQVMGEYDRIVLTSPSGEIIDLNQERPILIPVGEVEDYSIRLEGQAEWVVIMVSSRDGEAHYLFIENAENTAWITHTGITAVTSYHFD